MTTPNDAKSWFAALVRAVTSQTDYHALYPARVVTQESDGTLGLVPEDGRIPAMTKVPLRTGIPGVLVKVKSGGRVLLGFENGDRRFPVATLWDASTLLELRITATTKVTIDCPNVGLGDESGAPLARLGDAVDIVFDASAIAAAVASGTGILQAVGVISSGASKASAS